jgi:hypothetical protein
MPDPARSGIPRETLSPIQSRETARKADTETEIYFLVDMMGTVW